MPDESGATSAYDDLRGLRLAVLGPISWPTPPTGYGPWEQIAYNIAAGMTARGLDVTLFATGNSRAPGKISAVVPVGLEEDRGLNAEVYSALHIGKLFERAGDFDLIHNNFDWKPLTYALATTAPPLITTIHGFSSPPILAAYYAGAARSFYCSISDADRDPGLAYLATTYNGIDPHEWTFRSEPGADLVFLARFHPEKGAHLAIAIAKKAGLRLKMAAIPQDDAYFKELVEPHIDGDQIQFLGHVKGKARDELLGTALALVHMTTRPERFGLTLVEAMACGTPVLGAAMGSLPEIVIDGTTGFLCRDVDEAVTRVPQLATLDRRACRRHVEKNVLNGTHDRPLLRCISTGPCTTLARGADRIAAELAPSRLVGSADGLYRSTGKTPIISPLSTSSRHRRDVPFEGSYDTVQPCPHDRDTIPISPFGPRRSSLPSKTVDGPNSMSRILLRISMP